MNVHTPSGIDFLRSIALIAARSPLSSSPTSVRRVMMTTDHKITIGIIIEDAHDSYSWPPKPPLLGCELTKTRATTKAAPICYRRQNNVRSECSREQDDLLLFGSRDPSRCPYTPRVATQINTSSRSYEKNLWRSLVITKRGPCVVPTLRSLRTHHVLRGCTYMPYSTRNKHSKTRVA